MTKALLPRIDYPSLAEWVYLNQASLGLVGEPAIQAMHHFLDDVARHGNLNMTDDDEVQFFELLRQRGASILNCQPDQLAILGSASELLGQLPFIIQPKAGSHILAVATDFPAITRPWLRYCAENDCSLRFVDDVAQANLTDSLIEQIGKETAVIAISYVQFATGSIVDMPRLRQAANQVGAKLIIDVTQAAGRIPIAADAWQADALVTSGYKWLGGHGGVALAAIAPHLSQQIPPLPGWMGAPNPFAFEATQLPVASGGRRFTQSTMSYVSLIGLTVALDQLLTLNKGASEAHAQQLAHRLINGCEPHGWLPFRPLDDVSASAHIVTLAHEKILAQEMVGKLREKHVICGARNGRIRISLAPYNNSNDVDALLKALTT